MKNWASSSRLATSSQSATRSDSAINQSQLVAINLATGAKRGKTDVSQDTITFSSVHDWSQKIDVCAHWLNDYFLPITELIRFNTKVHT